jgi:hypothetical protein
MAEVLKTTADLMSAREGTARLADEVAAFQARPWWRRLAGLRPQLGNYPKSGSSA